MAKHFAATRRRSTKRGSAIVEYVVATSMALGALLLPLGSDSRSVFQRLIESIQAEHSGYLYAASVPSLPKGNIAGGDLPSGDADAPADSGPPSGEAPDPGNSGASGSGGATGGDVAQRPSDPTSSGADGGDGDPPPGSPPDPIDDDDLDPDDLVDEGTDGDTGNGEGSCPLPAPNQVGSATNDAFISASQRNGVVATHVGNPIHVVTGNKYQREVDVLLPALHLAFTRHYNSRSTHHGAIGSGWTHGFDIVLSDRGDRIVLWQADGRRIDFRLEQGHHGTRRFRPPQHGDGFLTADRGGYEWHWRDRTVLGFDRNRQLRHIRDDQRRTLRLIRDGSGRLDRIINEAGQLLTLGHDLRGRIDSVSTPEGRTVRYRYDDHDNLIQVEYADRDIRRYHYEDPHDAHNLTGISVGADGGSLKRIKTWGYDATDRGVLYRSEYGGGQINLVYEEGGTRVLDADQRSNSIYFNDTRGGTPVVSRIEGPGCSPCQASLTSKFVRYEYDDDANLLGVTAADGSGRRYRRDALGRIVERIDSRIGAGTANRLQLSYWRDTDEIESVSRASIKPDAVHAITLRYRDDGQIEERIETGFAPTPHGGYVPIRRSQRFAYAGNRLAAVGSFRPGVEASMRLTPNFEDGSFSETFPDGGALQVQTWDERGRPRLLKIDDRAPLELHYGMDGRMTSASSAQGRIQFEYGADGRLVGMRKSDGDHRRIDLRRSPADDRPFSAIRQHGPKDAMTPRPIATASAAVAPGVRSITDPGGSITRYGIDDFGRRVFTQSPDSGLTSYEYDEDDNLRSTTIASNATASFVHDAARRLTEVRMQDDVTRFGWSFGASASRISKIQTPKSVDQTRYDEDGRVVEQITTIGPHRYVTGYGYREDGTLEWKGLPDGRRLDFRYRTGLLHSPELAAIAERRWMREVLLVSNIRRRGTRAEDRVEGWTTSNGIETSLRREQGRLAGLRIGALHDFTYAHDARGRITGIDDRGQMASRYRFDARGRLDLALTSLALAGYRYDLNGNRTGIVIDGHPMEYGYARQSNRLVTVTARSMPWTPPMAFGVQAMLDASSYALPVAAQSRYAIDVSALPARVQVSHSAEGGIDALGALRFGYDANGQIADVWRGARHLAHYRYDARAQRIAKQIPGIPGERQFLYEDGRLTAEADGSGRVQVQYLYIGRFPVAMLTDDATYFIHANHLGAPIAVTDVTRRVIWSAVYEPFGRATVDEDPDRDGTPFTFNLRLPGQYEDIETGLHYNHHRYYDPDLGRYLSPDPLGLAAGPNPYVYAGNDPVNHIDPTGLLLFAFDGTGNNDPPIGKRDISNIVKFRDAYLGDRGELGIRSAAGTESDQHYFYISGAATRDARTGITGDEYYDALTGTSMLDRVAALADDFFDHMAWLHLNHQKSVQLNIDTIGFSRGAAQARVFTNLLTAFLDGKDEFVLDHNSGRRYDFSFGDPDFARKVMRDSCIDVNLRFMGLFDTVPHYGGGQAHLELPGASQDDDLRQLDLGVGKADDPNAMQYVAHAVAANEDRQGFHVISIHPHPLKGNTEARMEMGFIGAHADIGGGYSEGDLSDVALMWMVKRAEVAGVAVSSGAGGVIRNNRWDRVRSPVLHDSKDSRVFFRDGRIFKYMNGVDQIPQRRWYDNYQDADSYGMDYALSLRGFWGEEYKSGPYPTRGTEDYEGNSTLVGLVNGSSYSQWLKDNYGLTIPIDETGLNKDRRPLPSRP